MKSFAWYDLQVIICSAIMMSYYFIVLRNKKFHQYNRFYILAVFFLSFIIPLVKIQLDKMNADNTAVQFIYVLADYNASIDKAVADKGFQLSWNMMAIICYVAVSAFFLFTFIVALLRIKKLLKQYSCKSLGEIYLIFTNVKGTPFSFFKYIFWNEEIDLKSTTGQQILQHELTHVKEKHSVDNIITQVVMIFGWFNPFFWLARKELQMIHEFIADKKSVDNGDASSLAEMLLAATYPQQQFLLTNSFFFSPIKRRLLMITNNKNPRFSYLRRLVVLPLMAVVVMLFAFRTAQKQNDALTQNVSKNNSSETNIGKNEIGNVGSFNDTKLKRDTNIFQVKSDTAGKQPIFFMDGKKITHDEMSKINPKDIESINVLKGKSATLKYGDDGKNGVIEIKMKNQNPLYVVDGEFTVQANKLIINSDEIISTNVLKGEDAIAKYGNIGKNGVIEITTKHHLEKDIKSIEKQVDTLNKKLEQLKKDKSESYDKVFSQTQVPAAFPGGKEAWMKYLAKNLNRALPVKNGAGPGKYAVQLSFIVDANGGISNIKAENDPGFGTTEEAIRMIKNGPAWIPAKQNGINVTSEAKQTITFVISEE
ncbi:BlaR1 peptidase M56 [mine drainage metagenome]|uniref:BlaR1 peptidase M56 n=1 Tax=mine drainage metagenome TaxID=410659 RepID=A0A1J5SX74_9ZZZZ